MPFVLGDTGAAQIGKSYFRKENPVAGNNLRLRLFTNDHTPTDDDVTATYTEATGGGYLEKTLLASNFTVSKVNGIVQAAYSTQQAFVFTGPLTGTVPVYGAYLVDDDGILIGAEKAAASYTPTANGHMYAVDVVIQISKGTPS